MQEWIDLLASGNIVTILIIVLILIVTGGVGAAIVNAVTASRRGVKGDALVRESNGITGLSKLTEGQDAFIETLRAELAQLKTDTDAYKTATNKQIENLKSRFDAEVAYSNELIAQLIDAKLVPVPRPPTEARKD